MKFETTTEQLMKAVAVAARFAEKRANLPVLGAVLLIAENGRLLLRATNLECGVEIVVPAKVLENGTVAVPAVVLVGFIHNAQGKTIVGSLVGESLRLETERVAASIKTLPTEDFPVLPRVSADKSFTIKSADLARAIKNVVGCASTSTVKPELQSVLLCGDGRKLTAVATDSFRLAEKTIPLRSGGVVPQLLFPARNAAELMRILEGVSGDIDIYYNENQISAHIENTYYTSRIIDGSFPNYTQIIPKEFTTEGVVLREEVSSALKSLAIFADKFLQVTMVIDPTKKAIMLSSKNSDVGEQTSTVRATVKGNELSMSFNSRYLADSILPIVGDSIRIFANGPGKPILVKDAVDESFLYLVMPMNR
ncbi:MAG: DNA polymerase III subunit beta [bacterium]